MWEEAVQVQVNFSTDIPSLTPQSSVISCSVNFLLVESHVEHLRSSLVPGPGELHRGEVRAM